jgi:hypothetical protein
MKIIGFAVFWSFADSSVQFHADVHASSAAEAARKFRDTFPGDVIRSVRSTSGRFEAFK